MVAPLDTVLINSISVPPRGQFNTSAIRVVTIEGNPWFVAADVARIMELPNISVSLKSKYIDQTERGTKFIGAVPFNIIAESALYKLILRSEKPQAKAFQDWVTKVVLPAIRKDGGYIMGEEKVATGEMDDDDELSKHLGTNLCPLGCSLQFPLDLPCASVPAVLLPEHH